MFLRGGAVWDPARIMKNARRSRSQAAIMINTRTLRQRRLVNTSLYPLHISIQLTRWMAASTKEAQVTYTAGNSALKCRQLNTSSYAEGQEATDSAHVYGKDSKMRPSQKTTDDLPPRRHRRRRSCDRISIAVAC